MLVRFFDFDILLLPEMEDNYLSVKQAKKKKKKLHQGLFL